MALLVASMKCTAVEKDNTPLSYIYQEYEVSPIPFSVRSPIMARLLLWPLGYFRPFELEPSKLNMRISASGSRESHMTKICNSGKLGEAIVRVSLTTQSTSPRTTLRNAIPSGFGN